MKTHYKVERMVPDYTRTALLVDRPVLVRKEFSYCGSNAYTRTSNIHNVTCKKCLKKLNIKEAIQ